MTPQRELRDKNISSRVSHNTKMELKRIKKDYNISTGDILTNYVECNGDSSHEIMLKINSLEERLKLVEKFEKEQLKILNYLKEEHTYILGEIKHLKNIKPESDVSLDKEENVKSTVKAFFDIRKQHTNVYGYINSGFDKFKVGKTLCGKNDVDYNVFTKSIEMIDGGLDLDEFLNTDLTTYGLIKND